MEVPRLQVVLRFGAGLWAMEGRNPCQKTKKAVSSQLDKLAPMPKEGGRDGPEKSKKRVDKGRQFVYNTLSWDKVAGEMVRAYGLKTS